jgi:hypothetical protein
LKGLIVENAAQIVDAVKFYQAQDEDVLLFGKILKHSIDEQFWQVKTKLEESVLSLVTFYLKDRYQRIS